MPDDPTLCTRCEWRPASRRGRCAACARYLDRHGTERLYDLVLRAIDREVEAEAVAHWVRATLRRR